MLCDARFRKEMLLLGKKNRFFIKKMLSQCNGIKRAQIKR
jgi:hypothetical protein